MKKITLLASLCLLTFSVFAAPAVKDVTTLIPLGSSFDGELLTGLEASTFSGNLTPAVFKITQERNPSLAKQFGMTECVYLFTGLGHLSTERVELRVEKVSCINSKGEIFEGRADGYLVDDVKMSGLPGKVVVKSGAELAKKALLDMQKNDGVSKGVSQDLMAIGNAHSRHYAQLSREMFPIIELEAGRKATVFMLNSLELHKVH